MKKILQWLILIKIIYSVNFKFKNMNNLLNGFNNGRDTVDGIGGNPPIYNVVDNNVIRQHRELLNAFLEHCETIFGEFPYDKKDMIDSWIESI